MIYPSDQPSMSRGTSGDARRTDEVDLRRIDPTHTGQDRSRSAAADQMLARVLATPRAQTAPTTLTAPPAPVVGGRAQTSTWRRRRWVLSGVAAAAAAAAVVLPSLLGGDGSAAYASWSPAPSPVSAERAAALQADCRQVGIASGYGGQQLAGLSEDRGLYSFTLVATPSGVGSCFLLAEPPVGENGEQEQGAVSWGSVADLPPAAVDGTTVLWGGASSSAEGEFTSAVGRVGDDVAAVRLTTADGRHVAATVSQGYFAAWWPGHAEDELTVRVTSRGGTVSERVLHTGDR